ncbi:hypothetical protein OIU78_009072 [Salix suchowensis]|nr:hypothetical protein OIU78_009072 [Salix suchowensis]
MNSWSSSYHERLKNILFALRKRRITFPHLSFHHSFTGQQSCCIYRLEDRRSNNIDPGYRQSLSAAPPISVELNRCEVREHERRPLSQSDEKSKLSTSSAGNNSPSKHLPTKRLYTRCLSLQPGSGGVRLQGIMHAKKTSMLL